MKKQKADFMELQKLDYSEVPEIAVCVHDRFRNLPDLVLTVL